MDSDLLLQQGIVTVDLVAGFIKAHVDVRSTPNEGELAQWQRMLDDAGLMFAGVEPEPTSAANEDPQYESELVEADRVIGRIRGK
jgi:hypothetical protein